MGGGGAMVDLNVVNDILSTRNFVGGIFGLLAIAVWRKWTGLPAVMQLWIARRQAIATEKGKDWIRLREEINRLDERCDHLQREVDECREREGVWMGRAIAAESKLQGEGDVRQAAAVAAAEVRLDDID